MGRAMNVGSTFSGIGGFDLGLERAGMKVVWQIENDPFCNRILARHWPEVPRYGDITEVNPGELAPVDLLCGGFPCQDLSVAGKRDGLAGERSALFWEFIQIADAIRPRWVLIENVPGLFSSQSGRDFLRVVSALDERGYGVAWRVLDSRYFGVAQRRRRVFIVGHLGAPCPPEVLFESESLSRNTPTGREAGQEIAGSLGGGSDKRGWRGDLDTHGAYVSHALPAGGRGDGESETFVAGSLDAHSFKGLQGQDASNPIADNYVVNARQDPIEGVSLDTDGHSHAVAVRLAQTSSNGWGVSEDGTTHTLDGTGGDAVLGAPADPDRVRGASRVPRGLDPATLDSPRYRALGNAVTVPVIEWIGRRIIQNPTNPPNP